ncbi:YihY/virulence factor BrkB family protein [Sphingomonas sp. LY160]|uniref:YihY/virulence factor BrkB family protein n=1 Tax=Sphingomonas sp. LY160 TaxID=3095342 RepID=UPI002ADEA5FE|nr:YihY/virulence factor BrkB family protein [Sphingomonas sp. LY160]MEA1073296.1 YihY/virulence factor BrkB family protein [Sphingomonas sp. LY160]
MIIDDRGRHAPSPWKMPVAGWKDVLVRTWTESASDNVGLVAAGVAFYAFLALVPLLGAIVLTYGLVAAPDTVIRNMNTLTRLMPDDVARLIAEQLMNVVSTASSKKGFGLLLALAVALFGARNAAGAIITALNIAYEEEEKRGFIKVTLLALAMTVAAVAFALLAVGLITAMRFLASLIPNAPPSVLLILRVVGGVGLVSSGAAAAATLYRYAPSRAAAKWLWLTPGTVLCAVGWLTLSAAFGFYVSRFANYGATYGSIGGAIALLTWVYLSSYIFLFGAELNSEFEHQTAKDTTSGTPQPLGSRGAWSADHVANGTDETPEISGKSPAVRGRNLSNPGVEAGTEQVPASSSSAQSYLVARATTRAVHFAGGAKISVVASVLSTVGLSMLSRRGKAKAGGMMLAIAAGLALLRRGTDD